MSTPSLEVDGDTAERNRKAVVGGGRAGRVLFVAAVASPMNRVLTVHRQYVVYPSVSR